MDKIDDKMKIYIQFGSFLVIWVLMIYIFHPGSFDLIEYLKQVPKAISGYVILRLVFIRWGWRLGVFQKWLVKIPDLQGTWEGELKSDWINPETNKSIESIPIILVIRQTYKHIKCTMISRESISHSTTASINQNPGDDELSLVFLFTNRSQMTIRDRSPIHDGASILRILDTPARSLEGEYWTGRKTRGEIKLSFKSQKLHQILE